jgi:uncharacterized protein YkwD
MKLKVFRLHRHGSPEGKLSGSTQDDDCAPDSSELMKRSIPKDTKTKTKPPRVSKPKKESLSPEEKKQSELPDCWYYSSCHILINRERAILDLPKLRRIKMLDDMARFHAEDMAENTCVFHSVKTADNLKHKLHSKYAGENIQRGKSIRSMHTGMMEKGKRSRDNILSKQFTEFGMGTAMGGDGKLYMVQMFRGPVYD